MPPDTNPHSILHISSPLTNPTLNSNFQHTQQIWLKLATTPFPSLTADSTLNTLITSACLVQRSRVNEVFLYGIVFNGGRVLMLRKQKELGEVSVWTVPHRGFYMTDDVDGSVRIRDAVMQFLRVEFGVWCDAESAYLMKARFPVAEGPTIAAIFRLGHVKEAEAIETGRLLTRLEIEQLDEHSVHPEGMKQLILEAFGQKEFEDTVLDA